MIINKDGKPLRFGLRGWAVLAFVVSQLATLSKLSDAQKDADAAFRAADYLDDQVTALRARVEELERAGRYR